MDRPITSTYLDTATGEPIEVFIIKNPDTRKPIIKEILRRLGITYDSAPELVMCIAVNLIEGNVFPYSQRQLSKLSGKSLGAVNRTMQQLVSLGIMAQKGSVYTMDAHIAELCRPDTGKNIGILYK